MGVGLEVGGTFEWRCGRGWKKCGSTFLDKSGGSRVSRRFFAYYF